MYKFQCIIYILNFLTRANLHMIEKLSSYYAYKVCREDGFRKINDI